MTFRLTRRARRDTLNIWKYIATYSESAADRMIDRLVRRWRLLPGASHAERTHDEIRSGYCSFVVGEYLIFYRVREAEIQIMHIVDGRSDSSRSSS